MSNENQNSFIDQLGRGLGGLFKFIIRLAFVLVLAVAVGAGLYYGIAYGIPALDRAYLEPVRNNTAAIADLEAQAKLDATQYSGQLAVLQERITALEVQNDTNLNTIDSLQTQLEQLVPLAAEQEALAEQVNALDTALQALDEALAQAQNENSATFAELQETLTGNQESLDAITAELAANDFPLDQAYADLQVVKAMALLTRAQVFTFQANYGLAAADIEAARTLLIDLDGDPALEGLDLSPILNRLSLALGSLPDSPDLASADLSVAWELLVEGISIEPVPPAEGEDSGETTEQAPS